MTGWNIWEVRKMTIERIRRIKRGFEAHFSTGQCCGYPRQVPFFLSMEAAGLVKIKASFQHKGTAALSH